MKELKKQKKHPYPSKHHVLPYTHKVLDVTFSRPAFRHFDICCRYTYIFHPLINKEWKQLVSTAHTSTYATVASWGLFEFKNMAFKDDVWACQQSSCWYKAEKGSWSSSTALLHPISIEHWNTTGRWPPVRISVTTSSFVGNVIDALRYLLKLTHIDLRFVSG